MSHDYLQQLQSGNERFCCGKPRALSADQHLAARRSLLSSQAPHTAVLACSDSRVSPELIFDAPLGELFAIRVAGNVVSDEVLGSLEYAIFGIGVRQVIVLGHSGCGAVHAAIDPGHTLGENTPLARLTDRIREHVEPQQDLAAAIESHVRGVTQRLMIGDTRLAHAFTSGEVRLCPAIYDLPTGKVTFFPE